ncbi:hypothetical protein [Candidatus Poriferisodalis sp.]|uniref:hypothetical protein n=1 Tax=Candidatus Poriferisodalis sp. TaxID=3101277 RepID=UPI003B014D81
MSFDAVDIAGHGETATTHIRTQCGDPLTMMCAGAASLRLSSQSVKQIGDPSQRRRACAGGCRRQCVEAGNGVPARVKGQVSTADDHPNTWRWFQICRGLVDETKAKHPHLRMHDATTWRDNGHNAVFKEGERATGAWYRYLTGLCEHGDVAGMCFHCGQQRHRLAASLGNLARTHLSRGRGRFISWSQCEAADKSEGY